MEDVYGASPSGREAGRQQNQEINVSGTERRLSLLGGIILAFSGASRLKKGKVLPGVVLTALGGMLIYRGKTGHCDLYQSLGISTAGTGDRGLSLQTGLTINRPPREVYDFWRRLENLPRFMRHLESVQTTGATTSHWKARGPGDTSMEWDAEIVLDHPGQRISWTSREPADIPNSGTVSFEPAPAGRGTELRVSLEYQPLGGAAGKVAAGIANGITAQQIKEDLRRLKQIMETGEIPTAARTTESRLSH